MQHRPTHDLARLWRAAVAVVPGGGVRALGRRARFVARAWRARSVIAPLLAEPAGGTPGRTIAARPALLGVFTAPYLNARWSPEESAGRLLRHLRLLDERPGLGFPITHRVELADLGHVSPGLAVVLDKPEWFHREGTLALNLFEGNRRLFTLAFALERNAGELVALIGGIQGRKLPNIADTYKALTKAAHGMRPRDLLLELFRALCQDLGVTRILAVADACRHHRHAFFGEATDRALPLDYDEIWIDRGGQRIDACFFALPTERRLREADEVPARKRAMYRQRYAMIEGFEQAMAGALARALPADRGEAD